MPDTVGSRSATRASAARDASADAQLQQLDDIFRSLSELSHKINNPLTAVMGRAQLLRGYPDTAPKILRTAEIIEESAARIAELVREVARLAKTGREEVLGELSSAAIERTSKPGRS